MLSFIFLLLIWAGNNNVSSRYVELVHMLLLLFYDNSDVA